MSQRDLDLDRLSTLLGQCLGRIDEHAFRVQRIDDSEDGYEKAEALEHEASTLQDLVGAMIERAQATEHSDLNQLVERAVQACIGELGIPIVVRQRLESHLPPIACAPSQLAGAVQRALVLAVDNLDVGGELILTTRRDDDVVAFELESRGNEPPSRSLAERAETLSEFVAELRGRCRVAVDAQQTLLLGIELPLALAIDD